MRSPFLLLTALPSCLLLAVSAGAQVPRGILQVDTAVGAAEDLAVASDGELTAVLYEDDLDNTMWVVTSDGRGLSWSAPVRIDDDLSGAGKSAGRHSLAVGAGRIYALWRDERLAIAEDVFFTYSDDGGATWAPNVVLDKGHPSGGNPVNDVRLAADGLNVVAVIQTDDGDDDLFTVYSTDGGVNWSGAIAVTAHNAIRDVDDFDLAVEGNDAFIAWRDNEGNGIDDNVWFSCLNVASGILIRQDVLLSPNQQAAGGDADNEVVIDIQGLTIVVAWQADYPLSSPEELRVAASIDFGGTWSGDVAVGSYTAGIDDVDNPEVLASDLFAIVTWEDDRSGTDVAYAAQLDLGTGQVLAGPDVALSTGTASAPKIYGDADSVAITWVSGAFPETSGAACSRDFGLTWRPEVTVSANTGDVDTALLAYNALYRNFVGAWLADDAGQNDVYVGGFRSATLTPVGTFAVGTPVHFEASGFAVTEIGDSFGVLVSGAVGSFALPFGDGRNTGLLNDAYLAFSLANIPGALSGTLDPAGSGATPSLNVPSGVPSGTLLQFAAVSFDVGGGGPTLGSMTDRVSVLVP